MFSSIFFIVSEIYYLEKFEKGWEKRWVKSSRVSEGKLLGRFRISPGQNYVDRRAQRGLQTLDDGRQYLISSKFRKCFNTSGKDFIFQFSLKMENKVNVAQASLKLMNSKIKQNQFSHKTPWDILFGPDFNDWDHHHLDFRVWRNKTQWVDMMPITAFEDHFTHVYTLIIFANQTYQLRKDNFTDIEGHLEQAFNYCQPALIPDPLESKPIDWEDDPEIDDPDEIPPSFLRNIPQYIPDPAAKKPEDWSDSINGIWQPPLIRNPEFYGFDWKPKRIKNPNYRGAWKPQLIPNPDYDPDPSFGKPEDLCYIGIDVEQDVAGSIWDNIIVTDSLAEAEKLMEETFFTIRDKERIIAAQAKAKENADSNNMFDMSSGQNDGRLPDQL